MAYYKSEMLQKYPSTYKLQLKNRINCYKILTLHKFPLKKVQKTSEITKGHSTGNKEFVNPLFRFNHF